MVTPRQPDPTDPPPRVPGTLHEQAMDRAVEWAHLAERSFDHRERDSYRAMSSLYVSMAKELRLGKSKSRTYSTSEIRQVTLQPPVPPPIPAQPLDQRTLVDEEEGATV